MISAGAMPKAPEIIHRISLESVDGKLDPKVRLSGEPIGNFIPSRQAKAFAPEAAAPSPFTNARNMVSHSNAYPRQCFYPFGGAIGSEDEILSAEGRTMTPAPLYTGRIVTESRRYYTLTADGEELLGEVSGRFRHAVRDAADYPKVGDWVRFARAASKRRAIIEAVLPRRSVIVRKVPGRRVEAQVLAVNVDVIFIVMGLDGNFNLRRLERLLALSHESGAAPVIVLNKIDVCDDLAACSEAVADVSSGVPVCAVSARMGIGLDCLEAHVEKNRTICFLGSSGAGKSTLINRLLGEERQKVGDVRLADAKGRHTTTRRELIVMPGGAVLIDTPGLREIQLWDAESGLVESFPEITGLIDQCRFRNCSHTVEDGCAVIAAVSEGRIDSNRYASWLALNGELARLRQQQAASDSVKNRVKPAGKSRRTDRDA